MATLALAASCSHAPPLLRHAPGEEQGWARLYAGYEALRHAVNTCDIDFMVVIYNDHFDNFYLNHMPTFAVGAAPSYQPADEGFGGFSHAEVPGAEAAGHTLIAGLVDRGFDVSRCYGDMVLDHGVTVPLPVITEGREIPIVPVVINAVHEPYPTARRCWDLGQAIRSTLDDWNPHLRYAVLATGGLSHQLAGEMFGRINQDFDADFLARLTGPQRSTVRDLTHEQMLQGGESAIEVLAWIACAGAVGDEAAVSLEVYEPLNTALTGMSVLIYE
jgi:protocatechuate 4,5-dioxygenase beta chain